MIAIWREIGTFVITEQQLVDQARVIRTNKWLTEVEFEEIRRKFWHPERVKKTKRLMTSLG